MARGWARFVSGVRNVTYSVADPALGWLFGASISDAGVPVTEVTAFNLSAFYRGVSVVAGTIGTLPMRTVGADPQNPDRIRRWDSWADNPGGDQEWDPTPMAWKEQVITHMMTHGDAFFLKVRGGGGQLLRLDVIHPSLVNVRWGRPGDMPPVGRKWYDVTFISGMVATYSAREILQISGLSLDGLRGISIITAARTGLGTAIAGDRAAARMFSTGGMAAGVFTPDDDMPPEEEVKVSNLLNERVNGWENNARFPVINRRLKFQQISMSSADAQFLESRKFQIEEISRWTGVPPHLLMQTDKQTSWGTGVEEQNNGLARFTLNPWTVRLEQALSRLLPKTRWIEFDFAGLERGTPEQEINLLLAQVAAGVMTAEEFRKIRNMEAMGIDNDDVDQGEDATDPAPAEEVAT